MQPHLESVERESRTGGLSLCGNRRDGVVGVNGSVMSPATFNRERKNDVQNSLTQVVWHEVGECEILTDGVESDA
jgi:hypothetical protein